MSRYFLHLREQSGSVVDDEGVDMENEDAAVQRAIFTIRDVVAHDILAGQPVQLASYIAIEDEDGHELRRVYVRDVIRFIDEPLAEAPPLQPG